MKITMNNRFTKEVITSSLLWGSGDFIAQKIKIKTKTKKRHIYDWNRTLVNALFGGFYVAPLGYHWYSYLDKSVCHVFERNTSTFICAKVFLETVLWNPCITVGYFFTINFALFQKNFKNILNDDFRRALTTETMYWPLIDTINFKYIPVHRNLLFMNIASLVDTILLSCIVNHS